MHTVLPNIFKILRRGVYNTLGFVDKKLNRSNPVSILAYHSISSDGWKFSIDKKSMEQQINYLKSNYDLVTLSTLEKYLQGIIKITKPSVVLTFDDGYRDILEMKSYFEKYDIKPALFLVSDTKNINLKEIGIKKKYLNTPEIKKLISAGWELGCHSNTHANLAKLDSGQLHKEIVNSKKSLEKTLGIKIKYFAYPRGKYTKNVLNTVSKSNYKMAFSMDDGIINPQINIYSIPRIGIDNTHSFSEFKSAFSPSTINARKFIKSTFIGRLL